MVSRRKILSRSRDDVTSIMMESEEDVWLDRAKLYRDHVAEVLSKWNSIDDEIWAKVIVFERNRRIAKAYARAPVLTVNSSDDGFDGFRIGLCGFQNPMRDPQTEELLKHIGHGVKLKMDDTGNILIKKVTRSGVFIKKDGDATAIGDDILKMGQLDMEKPMKLFDMKKFQSNVSRELRSAYPDRKRLEYQCLTPIVFVKSELELLDCPIWLLIINVVAIDMLRARLPPVNRLVDIKNRPRIPIPDEDPYSIAGSNTESSAATSSREDWYQRSQDKPPKLPPRKITNAHMHNLPKPNFGASINTRGKKMMQGVKKIEDDPYYCGLKARVPDFVMAKTKPVKQAANPIYGHKNPIYEGRESIRNGDHHRIWYTKSLESGIDSPYNHIFGKVPVPTRAYIPHPRHGNYVQEWDS